MIRRAFRRFNRTTNRFTSPQHNNQINRNLIFISGTTSSHIMARPTTKFQLPHPRHIRTTLQSRPQLTCRLNVTLRGRINRHPTTRVTHTGTLTTVAAKRHSTANTVARRIQLRTPQRTRITTPNINSSSVFRLQRRFARRMTTRLSFTNQRIRIIPRLTDRLMATTDTRCRTIINNTLTVDSLTANFTRHLTLTRTSFVPNHNKRQLNHSRRTLRQRLVAPRQQRHSKVAFCHQRRPTATRQNFHYTRTTKLPLHRQTILMGFSTRTFRNSHRSPGRLYQIGNHSIQYVSATVQFNGSSLLHRLLKTRPTMIIFIRTLTVRLIRVATRTTFLFKVAHHTVRRTTLTMVTTGTFTFRSSLRFVKGTIRRVRQNTALFN